MHILMKFLEKTAFFCGEFKTKFEAQMYPLKHVWCIQGFKKNTFDAYRNNGSRFFIIENKQQKYPYIFVLAELQSGIVRYYDSNHDILMNDNIFADKFIEYEYTLPNELKQKLYEIANSQILFL